MIIPGLVSITFRNKTPRQICTLCERAGLKAVEWGSDVHVPSGNMKNAREVSAMSSDSGIETAAYGSYFRVGQPEDGFKAYVETAAELGTDLIRVWCGSAGSAEMTETERERVTDALKRCCEIGREYGLKVAPEFHGGTLTDSPESVTRLFDDMSDVENVRFYWQPRWDWDESVRLETLDKLLPRLAHIHTFTWKHTPDIVRLPLGEGETMWEKVFERAKDVRALIEFVREDSDKSLMEDAQTLKNWADRSKT